MGRQVVAIVGVPNVGKSTLFNRLVGRRRSLVGPEPGVTRDRIEAEVDLAGRRLLLVDTGGTHASPRDPLAEQVRAQVQSVLARADLLLFVVSVREGPTSADHELAPLLRRAGRPVILVANKVDNPDPGATVLADCHELGLGDPAAVSAEHGLGIGELVERIHAALPPGGGEAPPPGEVRDLAIVGRPNTGKSSLLNTLCREDRAIVSERPGTTRDEVDLLLAWGAQRYRVVDTAGIRRSARVTDPIDRLSVRRAADVLQRSDLALLVVDAAEGITAGDVAVAGLARRFIRPVVILANKWDLQPAGETARARFREELQRRLRFARFAPLRFVSARTGAGVDRVLPTVERVWEAGGAWVGASRLNRFLHGLGAQRDARTATGRRMRFTYIAQNGVHPPSFIVFSSVAEPPAVVHRRFLENRLREAFDFRLTPIALHWRRK